MHSAPAGDVQVVAGIHHLEPRAVLVGRQGWSIKAIDLCGAYCCTACDAVVDGQAKPPAGYTKQDVTVAWFHGHLRSLVILKNKGLIK
jgi:hypothetical protein